MSKGKAIIVKKVKKNGGGGHHGGAWKVAYADFVTAMMAFFLLMWLLNMTSEEKRARLSTYFKYFSIYDSGGTSWMDKSSEIFNEAGESSQKAMMEKYATVANLKDMEQELKEGIMNQLGDAKDQVVVDTVDGGVRIQMTDKDGSLMFETGSNKLTPKARNILQVIGNNIKGIPSKVAIEGHTDALPYSRSDYSNWELSTERASTARKELEAYGLDSQRIDRVSGFADKDPLIRDNPKDPRNRRISIILKAPDAGYKPVKTTEQPVTKKEEPRLIIKKFDENLSLINDGADAAGNKTVQKTFPEKNDIKDKWPPANTSKETPVTTKNKESAPAPSAVNKPPSVIKELSSPVISKDDLFR